MTDKQDPITHAARLLREAAEELRQAHTLSSDRNNWIGEPEAKAAYDEHMAAAQALEDWEAAVGAGGVQPLRNTTPDQVQKPVAYAVFAENGNIRLWSQQPVDTPRIVPLYSAPQPLPAEVLGWIYEDELPQGYPYEAMHVHSRVDGVRLFPVFGPHAAPLPTTSQLSEQDLRTRFEALARDSYNFKRSRRDCYVNPATARDWKWFRLGANVTEQGGK